MLDRCSIPRLCPVPFRLILYTILCFFVSQTGLPIPDRVVPCHSGFLGVAASLESDYLVFTAGFRGGVQRRL